MKKIEADPKTSWLAKEGQFKLNDGTTVILYFLKTHLILARHMIMSSSQKVGP